MPASARTATDGVSPLEQAMVRGTVGEQATGRGVLRSVQRGRAADLKYCREFSFLTNFEKECFCGTSSTVPGCAADTSRDS